MDDDKNLILDRPMSGKSNEQLRRHTLDSTFEDKPVERALYILTKGDDVQKLSIIQTLPQLVKIDQQATFSRIMPKIQQELPKASAEFQITTSQIFRVLIEKKLPVNLLGAVIQGVDSRDPIVSSAWMDTLLSVTPFLHIDIIRREILPLLSVKSQLSQPVIQRVAACRIIGKIANHKELKSPDIRKDVLPFVHSLCQDTSVEVRAIMCVQLPAVAEGLTMPFVKANLLPSYIDLSSDTSPLVREAAVLTMVNLLSFLEKDTLSSTIVPLMKKFCEKDVVEDNTAAIISSQFGRILSFLGPLLKNGDKTWFFTYFKTLSRKGFGARPGGNMDASKDVICRENCATNFPVVAEFVNNSLPSQRDALYSTFRDMVGDPCYIVRKAVATCIFDITKILAPQNRMLKADIVRLLRDDAEDVLQMLVPKLSNTLLLLLQFGYLAKDKADQTTMEITRALLKCQIELSKGYNWRLLVNFIEQLECLPKCMPGEFIHQHFTPTILGTATNGKVKPIIHQSTKTLLIFLRYNIKENQQKWLRDSLINQFCYSDSCYKRQIFIKICFNALEVFSSKYFKAYFLIPLLNLANDRVANIRYSLITILPKIKLITLCPPLDPKHKILFQEAIQKLEAKAKEKFLQEPLKRTLRDIANMSIAGNKEFYSKDLQKQEDENKGNAGAGGAAVPAGFTSAPGTVSAPRSAKSPARPNVNVQTKVTPNKPAAVVSNKPAPAATASVEMNFLEQHFYIDAGVALPETIATAAATTEPVSRDPDEVEVAVEPPPEVRFVETVGPNATDDVKASLRKTRSAAAASQRRRSSNIPVVASASVGKRHSGVFSTGSEREERTTSAHKRHSLSLPTDAADFSKIPVCTWKRGSRLSDADGKDLVGTDEPADFKLNANDAQAAAKSSGLPVAIRRRK